MSIIHLALLIIKEQSQSSTTSENGFNLTNKALTDEMHLTETYLVLADTLTVVEEKPMHLEENHGQLYSTYECWQNYTCL